ncbi:ABC transporter substrate-binding protein [Plantibacter sp. ME-Dv--P-122b]|uniref:ABC transporter substrate-binding protein n=1 Tax=Plantibacter sp. ME-Dv--P-122b TaxID=3040300 RepID=UPI002550E214|nr:ABC transporter substrate-binding protein [Plantibacter sp. ME-Dv--P-122b]
MSLNSNRSHTAPVRGIVRGGIAVASTAALMAVLAGCSGAAPAASADGSGELTFFSWDNEEKMSPLITEFEEENPDITIKFSYAPPVQEYSDTLQKRLMAGNAADVFILGNHAEQVGGGFVKDLTGTAAAEAVSDFNRDMQTVDGKVYGISVASWGGGMLVNKDITAKVGVTEAPQTWDEFLALCAKLKDAGITPYLEAGDGISTTIMGSIGLAQADDGDADFETAVFEGDTTFSDTWTKPLERWAQLYQEGLVTKDAAALTGQQINDEFNNGRVAMVSTGSWQIGAARDALGDDANIDFWPVPGDTPGDTFWAGAASPPYAINAKAKNPVGAQKWVDFLASETGVKIFHETTGSITTTNNYTPELDPALAGMYEDVIGGRIYCTWQVWPGKNSAPLDAEFLAKVQETMLGQSDAEDITKALDTKFASLK